MYSIIVVNLRPSERRIIYRIYQDIPASEAAKYTMPLDLCVNKSGTGYGFMLLDPESKLVDDLMNKLDEFGKGEK